MKFNYQIGANQYELDVDKKNGVYRIKIGEQEHQVSLDSVSEDELQLRIDGNSFRLAYGRDNGKLWLSNVGRSYVIERIGRSGAAGAGGVDGGNLVCAPMPGQVREVMVAEGEQVERGQILLLLEAMKMEMRILAPRDGVVLKMAVMTGQQVDKDDLLAEVE